jgi:NAD(P)-dependent dehydrogenase (short-subunit alcohol dehydrogenase family)
MGEGAAGATVLAITGAASGMGAAAVELALAEGSRILALDRDASALRALSHRLGEPAALTGRGCDVTSPDDVAAAASWAERALGPLDGLLNFAGVSDFAPMVETTDEVWARQIGVNLSGTFNACRAFGAGMVRQGHGAIVNVASTAGQFGVPGMAAYTAVKHGVVGLTRALAVEWGPAGVRVNCICPGATLSPMLLGTTPEYREARIRRIPLGRLGEPTDQASVALFLVSERAAYVTGAIVPVDGGVAAMAPGTSEAALGR